MMVAKIGNWSDTPTLLKNYAHPEKMAQFAKEVATQDKRIDLHDIFTEKPS